jgi:transcription initiation factor TFIIB
LALSPACSAMLELVSLSCCPRCNSNQIIEDAVTGEDVCADCGLVVNEDALSGAPEWRAFTFVESLERSRVGSPISYTQSDLGLSTTIRNGWDAKGNRLDSSTISKMRRLMRSQNRVRCDDSQIRNLNIALVELDRMSSTLSLPHHTKQLAALIYRRALNRDLIRGRSIDAFVAASIHLACRTHGIPRSLRTIVRESKRCGKEVSRTYRLLLREFRPRLPVDHPMKYVSGIASKLGLKPETERRAVELLERAGERRGLTGKDPKGIAAAAIYMACMEKGEKRIQKMVAANSDTTEVTLRNRLRGLERVLSEKR